MDKPAFLELAASASHKGLDDMDYSTRQAVMQHQLGCASHEIPNLEDFTPTAFYTAYESGGAEGGNYWGASSREFTNSKPDADRFDVLDDFLEEYFPKISFMTYRRLTRSMESSRHTVSEYYGNRTDYALRVLPFEALWAVLEEAGLTTEQTGGLYR